MNYNVILGATGADNDVATAYDANGNILRMQQWGLRPSGGSAQIDDLRYDYYTNTNKLKAVSEQLGSTNLKLGDFTELTAAAEDYGYDKNGNLVSDLNKQITCCLGDLHQFPILCTHLHSNFFSLSLMVLSAIFSISLLS